MPTLLSGLNITWKVLWRVTFFYAAWAFPMAIFFIPLGPKLSVWFLTSPVEARLYTDSVSTVTILAATYIMLRYFDHRPFKSIGFEFTNSIRDTLTGLLTGSLWLLVTIGTAWLCGWVHFITPTGFSWGVMAVCALSMLLNVATQELLLCGFIFQTIRSRSNSIIAVIISAALFAGYHAGAFKGEWLPVLNVYAAGILFCLTYLLTNNLWLPVAIHFAWDVLLGPVLGITESGINNLSGGWKIINVEGPQIFTGGRFGMEGGLIVTFTTLTITCCILYLIKKSPNPFVKAIF